MQQSHPKITINKIIFFMVGSAFITAILILRLFQLQVMEHNYYQEIATKEQYGYVELPAQRGEIIIKDFHSNEEFLLATNMTLNLLYADPALIKDPFYAAEKLTPIIFDNKEERQIDNARIEKSAKNLPKDITPEEKEKLLKPLTDDELKQNFEKKLAETIGEKQRKQILLAKDLPQEDVEKLASLNAPGIEIIENKIYAYPAQIKNTAATAEAIADYVKIPSKKLAKLLKGGNRYVIIKRKLSADTSEKIKELIANAPDEMLAGIGLQEEYYRYYPEETLAANIVGYINKENIGQYGLESTFNTQLQGISGKFQTKMDSVGRQITVGESVLEPAIDGDDIVLTIDRSIQLKIEQILKEDLKEYQADNGQVLIMNPKTGAIIAMAHYPTFNPNNFGDAFKKIEIKFSPEDMKKLYPANEKGVYYFYTNPLILSKYIVFEEKDEQGNSHYYRYENFVGPEVYHNKIVSWPYEPGSAFKSIAMAAAIDDNDVTANTTYNDTGPVKVDWNVYKNDYDYAIKNAEGEYFGLVNMTTVLAKSINTGITFVAKKMGPALFYSYLEKFGFLTRTDIEFDSEITGKIEYYEDWTESELATHAFGQGITVTPIQLTSAYSAIVNGGILMQPHIIQEIRHADEVITVTEPHEIRRVISEDTSAKMVAMLVNGVESGVAAKAQVKGHYVGGKTGTSQTYKHGEALSENGTTITSYVGFGPAEDPQFVIFVKFDHPKTNEWCSNTSAPTAGKIAAYLFDYYNIPPDK